MDNGSRYVGLEVHRDTISVAVCDSRGKLILERVIPTSAAAVLELLELLRGKLHVAFEEGTSAQWLAGLLQPRVAIKSEQPWPCFWRQCATAGGGALYRCGASHGSAGHHHRTIAGRIRRAACQCKGFRQISWLYREQLGNRNDRRSW